MEVKMPMKRLEANVLDVAGPEAQSNEAAIRAVAKMTKDLAEGYVGHPANQATCDLLTCDIMENVIWYLEGIGWLNPGTVWVTCEPGSSVDRARLAYHGSIEVKFQYLYPRRDEKGRLWVRTEFGCHYVASINGIREGSRIVTACGLQILVVESPVPGYTDYARSTICPDCRAVIVSGCLTKGEEG